jgi:Glycosyltransferase family 87
MPHVVLIRRLLWLVAAASLTFGVWKSLQPASLLDFQRVVAWSAQLVDGTSPYVGESETDYPPWALVTVPPLDSLPAVAQAPLWIGFNVLLACGIALLLTRVVATPHPYLLPLLLAASPFRVLGQFSIFSFALALSGARHPSPLMGGLLLGLGLMKPQVGGAILLAHLFMRDWVRVGVALCVPVVLTLVACLLTSTSPIQMVGDYVRVLDVVHGADVGLPGHTDLKVWLAPLMPSIMTLEGTAALVSLLLLPALVVAARHRGPWSPNAQLELYALCGAVSLLSTRHLSYDLLLILPVIVAWRAGPWLPWLVTCGLVIVQVPGWWRQVFEPMGWPVGFGVMLELDRVLCVALFGLLSWRLMRLYVTE